VPPSYNRGSKRSQGKSGRGLKLKRVPKVPSPRLTGGGGGTRQRKAGGGERSSDTAKVSGCYEKIGGPTSTKTHGPMSERNQERRGESRRSNSLEFTQIDTTKAKDGGPRSSKEERCVPRRGEKENRIRYKTKLGKRSRK